MDADPDPRDHDDPLGGGVVVEVLYIPSCPHLAAAAENLRRALVDGGFQEVVTRFVEISSVGDAGPLGFGGSPTFLVRGRDLFGDAQLDDLA